MENGKITRKERDCLVIAVENSSKGFPVKLVDLSKKLKIKPPTALDLVRRLEKKGMLESNRGMIIPTEEGIKRYGIIIYAHRIIECALKDSGESDVDSCLEAAGYDYLVSANLVSEMDRLLGNPETCPHGKKIIRDEVNEHQFI